MPAKSRPQIMTQGKSRRQKIVMPGKSRQQKIYLADKLKNELAQIPFYPLTVVVSPSGFGKTTAVREYFKECLPDDARLYWYTCLSENSSAEWAGICDLFTDINSETAKNLKELEFLTPESLIHISAYLKDLRINKETYIVIDNFQLLKSDILQDLINVMSMHGNPHLHIIIITQNFGIKK